MRFQCEFEAGGDMGCSATPDISPRSDLPAVGMRIGLALRSKKVRIFAIGWAHIAGRLVPLMKPPPHCTTQIIELCVAKALCHTKRAATGSRGRGGGHTD